MIFENDVLVFGTTIEQLHKRMLAFKGRLRETNITIIEKNLIQNQSMALFIWDTLFQKSIQHHILNMLKK